MILIYLYLLYLLDWSFVAMRWRGVSPCMQLGVGDCVVWWDGWAVAMSFVGILATVFLGVATIVLGIIANANSAMAASISLRTVLGQEAATAAERDLILVRIQAEVAAVDVVCQAIKEIFTDEAYAEFCKSSQARSTAHALVKQLRLPVTKGLTPRLHTLSCKEALYLARSLGACDTLRQSWQGVEGTDDPKQLKMLWNSLSHYRTILSHDLSEIRKVASSAVAKSGITSDALAAALGIDPAAIKSSAEAI